MTIWDRLWAIDPMNTGQQPQHDWVVIDGKRAPRLLEAPFPSHDTRNEERYNSIETLLRLVADLGLTVQITQFARGGLGRCLVKVWPQGKQEKGARVRDTLATVALANAILEAEEVSHA